MTFLSTDKMKISVLVVAFLLLASAFTFLPAVGAFSTTAANTGSSSASVSGATAAIDYPILAGYGIPVTRTITVTNPIGNTPISTFTVSIPKAAVGANTPTGAIGAGTSGTVAVFGTGPWAIVYTATGGSTGTLVPGGAAVTFTVTFTTESTFASASGVADPYTLSTSVTDTTGAATNLNTLTVYETASTTVSVAGPTTSVTAGAPFTVTVSGTDSGLPLQVVAIGSLSNGASGFSATTIISPTSFTTGSSSQSVSVNDTTEETLNVTVIGGTHLGSSSGGFLSDSWTLSANALTIHAGPVTSVAVAIAFNGKVFTPNGAYKIINVTNAWTLKPIYGSDGTDSNNITVSTADKFGNPAPFGSATTVTLSVITTSGQSAGFSVSQSAYGSSYPYTPTGGVLTSITVPISSTSYTLNTSTYYFFGVDYGSSSYILASANTLSSGKSSVINTYTLNAAAMTVKASSITPKAGTTVTVNATIAGTQQAGVPINFANTTATTGMFSNGLGSVNTTTTINSGVEVATATFTPSTVAGATVTITANEGLPGADGVFAYNTVASTPVTLTTAGGAISKLVIETALTSFVGNPGTPLATTVTSNGQLYVAIQTADAYGNPSATSANTQIALSTTGGLSATLLEIESGMADTVNSSFAGLTQSIFTPTTGSAFTITATATVNGAPLTGSVAITVVSPTPLLSISGPSTRTTGVPSTITGTANASTGVANNEIKTITYTVNGGSQTSVGFTPAANVAFTFQVLLTKNSYINVTVTDSAGNQNFQVITVPLVSSAQSFNFTVAPVQTTVGQYKGIAVNITNSQAQTLTAIAFVSLTNSAGQTVGIFTATASNVAAGTSVIVYPVITGVASGSYTATIFVLSTSGVPLSPTTTLSVTL